MSATDTDSRALSAELESILDDLVSRCSLKTAVLATRDGTVIQARGDTGYFDVTALAALLGAMFSATREVARMVGEDHFSILLQQGEKRHIHISLIPESTMLSLIFEDVGKIGMIRMHTRRVSDRLAEIAAQSIKISLSSSGPEHADSEADEQTGSQNQTTEFREYALDLIDRIFAED